MVSLLKIISQGMMLDHSPATPKSVTGKKKQKILKDLTLFVIPRRKENEAIENQRN